jgi:hypothetical protein
MPLIAGQVEPFEHRAKKGTKGAGVIPSGSVLVKDAALTPDGWKQAVAASVKAFGVLINADAATGDTNISVCIEGEVNVIAEAIIEPNTYVMPGTAAGQVKAWDGTAETTKVGLYLGNNGSGSTPVACAAGEVIAIIKEAD